MSDSTADQLKDWPKDKNNIILQRPTYEELKIYGKNQTPENYVAKSMDFMKRAYVKSGMKWEPADAVLSYADARMGAFEAEHVKNAKPVDSYSPVKGYKSSDI